MRLHLVALPHTQTTVDYATCAYTQKVRKFGKMMTALGHDVVIYSGEENDAVCAEHVPLLTERRRRTWFGANDQGKLHPITWDADAEHWRLMNRRAIAEIAKRRANERDLLLLTAGCCQTAITEGLPGMTACEPFVGYQGITTPFRAFESSAWMHHVYGQQRIDDGVFYDEVIPNFFDPDEFPAEAAKSVPGGGYLLFVGRVVTRKGPHVAAQIAHACGLPLKIAGPLPEPGSPDHIDVDGEYLGPVGIRDRARLMAGAAAVLAPTLYIEPFGGVAVEAMLCGTPAITTDWGAFRETVENGLTGYRFRLLQEGVDAVDRAASLRPSEIRARALERFALAPVGRRFSRWITRLDGLWGEGWPALRAETGLAA